MKSGGLQSLLLALLCPVLLNSTYAQQVEVSLTDAEGQPLEDAVIELVLPEQLRSQYLQTTAKVVDQRDKEFVPTVTVVTVGSQVNFPNSDNILHHVYSFSPAKTFNIPLYGQGENDDYFETFTESGIVEIGCNIHDWMLAYLYIADSTLVALSDESGVARLDGLPEGEFTLRVWHPRAADSIDELAQTVILNSAETTALSVSVDLRRDRRVRRAPGSNGRRYR